MRTRDVAGTLCTRIVYIYCALAKSVAERLLGFNRVSRLRIGISLCPASTANCRVKFLLNIYWTLLVPYYTYSSHLWYSFILISCTAFIFRLVFPLTWFDFRAEHCTCYQQLIRAFTALGNWKLNWIVVSFSHITELYFTSISTASSKRLILIRFFSHRPDWLLLVSPNSWTNPSCASNHWKKTRQKHKKTGSLTSGLQLSNWRRN